MAFLRPYRCSRSTQRASCEIFVCIFFPLPPPLLFFTLFQINLISTHFFPCIWTSSEGAHAITLSVPTTLSSHSFCSHFFFSPSSCPFAGMSKQELKSMSGAATRDLRPLMSPTRFLPQAVMARKTAIVVCLEVGRWGWEGKRISFLKK